MENNSPTFDFQSMTELKCKFASRDKKTKEFGIIIDFIDNLIVNMIHFHELKHITVTNVFDESS